MKKQTAIEYCDFKIVEGMVNVLEAEKGTGKTECVKRYLNSLKEGDEGSRVLAVAPRVSLNMSLAIDFGFTCYLDVTNKNTLHNVNKLVCSPEHLPFLLSERMKPYDVVFIDESEQTLNHIVTSPTVTNKEDVVNTLGMLCGSADTVILADANPDLCTERFVKLLSDENYIKPKHKAPLKPHTFKPRFKRGDVFETVDNEKYLFCAIEKHAKENRKFVVICDTKKKTKEVYDMVKGHYSKGKVLLLNSDTKCFKTTEKLLTDPNSYDVVIYSPKLGTGFSIKEGHHFTIGFAHFDGSSVNAEGASQMLARFRGLGHYIGYIKQTNLGYELPTDFDTLMGYYKSKLINDRYQMTRLGICLFDVFGRPKIDFRHELAVCAECVDNRSKNDFNAALRAVLVNEGFSIKSYEIDGLDVLEEAIAPKKTHKPKPKLEDSDKLKNVAGILNATDEELKDKVKIECYKVYFEATIAKGKPKIVEHIELVKGITGLFGFGLEVGGDGLMYDEKGNLLLDTIPDAKVFELKHLYEKAIGGKLNADKNRALGQFAKVVGLVKDSIKSGVKDENGVRSYTHFIRKDGLDELKGYLY